MNKADLVQKIGLHKLFKPFFGGVGHILLLHRVSNEDYKPITGGLQVSQDYLQELIEFLLAKEIDIISMDECYFRIKNGIIKKRFVVFTFDDGYSDNYTHALPVFEKYNMPFTIFLTTSFPEKKGILWWYFLEDLVLNNTRIEFKYEGTDYLYYLHNLKDKKSCFTAIKKFILESKSYQDYLFRLGLVFNTDIEYLYELTSKLCLSWKQVEQLSNHPLATIGAHTVNHLALNRLYEHEALAEIKDSISKIEEKTGKSVLYFAYPFGTIYEASIREFNLASNCKIHMALTSQRKNIMRASLKNLYSVPRIGINSSMKLSHIDLFINGFTPVINNFLNV